MRAVILVWLLLATPVAAQTPITPEALLDRLVGGSATFTDRASGTHVGVEYFPSRERSFWLGRGGRCTYGEMTIEAGALCFRYDDRPEEQHCWLPFEEDGELGYVSVTTGEVQTIRTMQGIPGGCTEGLSS